MREDGEDEIAHFSGDGTNGNEMMFAPGAELLIVGRHGGITKGGAGSSNTVHYYIPGESLLAIGEQIYLIHERKQIL